MRIGTVVGLVVAAMAIAQPMSGGVTPAKGMSASKCPGSFSARQFDVGGARTVWTVAFEDKGKKDKWWPEAGSMGVHVALKFAQMPARSLEFSVSYLPSEGRTKPSNRDAKSGAELQKSYSVVANDKALVQSDLLVGPASTITRVRLTGATLADGSEWHAANENACGVEPDRVLAVEGKESSLKW